MHIAMIAAEAVPYVKVGGLADVAGALPRQLAALGARVTLVLPGYRRIDRASHGFHPKPRAGSKTVSIGGRLEAWTMEAGRLPDSEVEVLLVGGRFFVRDGVYTDPQTGRDFDDQAERWVFFARAALAALAAGPSIDVLHCNDYHTALVVPYARALEPGHAAASAATFFSIHNLGYQGVFRSTAFRLTGLPETYMAPMGAFEFWGGMNLMKGGLVLADLLGTVSPTYAQEIQSSDEFGHGLQGVLRGRSQDLVGILNGVDTRIWNPRRDPWIEAHYDAADPSGKLQCKRALLERLGLPFEASRPLFGCITRLAAQKGIDLLLGAVPLLVESGAQLVVLGSGQPELERTLHAWARRFPRQISVTSAFDEPLAHAIEAGADFYLMPSRYEPCGLNQLYSLAYGTIPIVRRTGGLADTVRDWDGRRGDGTGFVFGPTTVEALSNAIRRALAAFHEPAALRTLMLNGMGQDFSWERSARRYLDAYAAARERAAARGRG
jgi:starch synthase